MRISGAKGLTCLAALGAMAFGTALLSSSAFAAETAAPAAKAAAPLPSRFHRTKDGKPDLSGFWNLARTAPKPDPQLAAKIAPNTVVLNDVGAPELPQGDYGGLILTPAAQAVAKTWKQQDDMVISKACSSPSIIYSMQGPFPIEIAQYPEVIIIKLEFFDMVRIIRMNGQHRPPNGPHTKAGDSIGHWEGDVLVVDTDHFEAATITNNGLYHGEKAHVIERFKLSPDGQHIISTQEFEDPDNITNRGARYITWDYKAGDYVFPYDCDPTFGLNYGNPEKK